MTRSARRNHPDRTDIEGFLSRTLQEEQDRSVEAHLQRGCLPCLFTARELALSLTREHRATLVEELFDPKGDAEPLERYGAWLDRKVLLIDLEERLVPALVAELMLRPPAARREAVRKERRYQLLTLSEALRQESRQECFRDVARAVELAELAVEASDCLNVAFYGPRLVADARALAYAILGNATRIAGDLFGAERQLRSALDLFELGTGSPMEAAELQSLMASLRIDQCRFEDAILLLDQVVETYRSQGSCREQGRAMVQLGYAVGTAGEPASAAALLEHSLDLLDPDADQALFLMAHHNVAAFLSEAGRDREARSHLEQAQPLYTGLSADRAMLLRRRRLEGRIAHNLGETEEAIAALQEVRGTYIDEDRAFDSALVTLDLAAVYLSQGRTQEVKRLAEEMYPVFRSQDVHRHALAALVLFKQAALSEVATIGFVRDVARYLDRARNNPYLAFEPTES